MSELDHAKEHFKKSWEIGASNAKYRVRVLFQRPHEFSWVEDAAQYARNLGFAAFVQYDCNKDIEIVAIRPTKPAQDDSHKEHVELHQKLAEQIGPELRIRTAIREEVEKLQGELCEMVRAVICEELKVLRALENK